MELDALEMDTKVGSNDDNNNSSLSRDEPLIVEGEAYQAPTENESRLKRLLDELDDDDDDQIRQRKEEEERSRRRRAASSKKSADELMKMLQDVLKGNKNL